MLGTCIVAYATSAMTSLDPYHAARQEPAQAPLPRIATFERKKGFRGARPDYGVILTGVVYQSRNGATTP